MQKVSDASRGNSVGLSSISSVAAAFGILLTAAAGSARAQAPAAQPATASPASAAMAASTSSTSTKTNGNPEASAVTNPLLHAGAFSVQTTGGELSEDQLKQLLVGKSLYLRGGYLDNNLEFDEWGRLAGHSSQGSFTLNEIQIDKVKLSKHRLELEGNRYALHFPGVTPNEDLSSAANMVKITPKKKTVRISFDRERVELPKKKKEDEDGSRGQRSPDTANTKDSSDNAAGAASTTKPIDHPPSDQKVTTTTSPAHASQLLVSALDNVFSSGIDDRLVQSMPDFWKLYFQSTAAKQEYKPDNPGVYRQTTVDRKAKLISALDPPSNEFAQAKEIAGLALYHAVIGSDGKVEKVVVARPIGFGLDENAEQTIKKAIFQPAVKDGKPVPVELDLMVPFRIYSKRTSQPATQEAAGSHPALPGPYTVLNHTQTAQQPQQPAQSPQ